MKLEEIIPGLRAGKTAWKRAGRYPDDVDRDYYRLGAGKYAGIERVSEYLNAATGRRSEYVRYYRLTRRDFERDDWEFGRFERSTEAGR
ncbi:MAG: hypothetical protein IKK39_12800 [Thermoguttaceae bacterium]|nr:hypothetical protein [Thermoguttaceae bacterium]